MPFETGCCDEKKDLRKMFNYFAMRASGVIMILTTSPETMSIPALHHLLYGAFEFVMCTVIASGIKLALAARMSFWVAVSLMDHPLLNMAYCWVLRPSIQMACC